MIAYLKSSHLLQVIFIMKMIFMRLLDEREILRKRLKFVIFFFHKAVILLF